MSLFLCLGWYLCVLENHSSAEKVYDIYLNETGNIYEFYSSKYDIFGYLIVERNRMNNEWMFEISEMSINTESPFIMKNAKNVYISYGNYFEYKDGFLYDSLNMTVMNYSDLLNSIDDNNPFFTGAGDPIETTEAFIYYSMTESETKLDYDFPYLSTNIRIDSSMTNNCSPTAGTSIVAYWDKYHSNLIPNYTPTISTFIEFIPPHTFIYETTFKNWDTITTSEDTLLGGVHDELYDLMNTSTLLGTTDNGFYGGLQDYFSDHSETLTRHSIAYGLWGTTVPWTDYKNEINLNRPVVLHLYQLTNSDYTLIDDVPDEISVIENYAVVYYVYYDQTTYTYTQHFGAHSVVGFGYKTFNYYHRNYYGYVYLYRTDNFMIVANGWASSTSGISYINITNDDIYKAYGIYPTN